MSWQAGHEWTLTGGLGLGIAAGPSWGLDWASTCRGWASTVSIPGVHLGAQFGVADERGHGTQAPAALGAGGLLPHHGLRLGDAGLPGGWRISGVVSVDDDAPGPVTVRCTTPGWGRARCATPWTSSRPSRRMGRGPTSSRWTPTDAGRRASPCMPGRTGTVTGSSVAWTAPWSPPASPRRRAGRPYVLTVDIDLDTDCAGREALFPRAGSGRAPDGSGGVQGPARGVEDLVELPVGQREGRQVAEGLLPEGQTRTPFSGGRR